MRERERTNPSKKHISCQILWEKIFFFSPKTVDILISRKQYRCGNQYNLNGILNRAMKPWKSVFIYFMVDLVCYFFFKCIKNYFLNDVFIYFIFCILGLRRETCCAWSHIHKQQTKYVGITVLFIGTDSEDNDNSSPSQSNNHLWQDERNRQTLTIDKVVY